MDQARIDKHLRQVHEQFGVTPETIMGRSRTPHVALARHAFYWLLRRDGLSYPQIGEIVGRHHTTVMHGVAAAEDRLKPRCTCRCHREAS